MTIITCQYEFHIPTWNSLWTFHIPFWALLLEAELTHELPEVIQLYQVSRLAQWGCTVHEGSQYRTLYRYTCPLSRRDQSHVAFLGTRSATSDTQSTHKLQSCPQCITLRHNASQCDCC